MEKVSRTELVKEGVLYTSEETRNTICNERKEVNCIGHILHRNSLLKYII